MCTGIPNVWNSYVYFRHMFTLDGHQNFMPQTEESVSLPDGMNYNLLGTDVASNARSSEKTRLVGAYIAAKLDAKLPGLKLVGSHFSYTMRSGMRLFIGDHEVSDLITCEGEKRSERARTSSVQI
jgi:hypothetical protein